MDTLNEEGVELGNLLSTNPKRELSWTGSVIRIQTSGILLDTSDTGSLNPDVAHEVTLGTDRDGHFVVSAKGANVIHALWLHGKVSVPFIVLTEEADLRVTCDIDILGAHGHEVN
jgi:hypothetical protein